jgi:hypothetical protein
MLDADVVDGVDDEDGGVEGVHDRNVLMGFHKVVEESSLSVYHVDLVLDQVMNRGAYPVFAVQAVYDPVEMAYPHLVISCLYPMVISF